MAAMHSRLIPVAVLVMGMVLVGAVACGGSSSPKASATGSANAMATLSGTPHNALKQVQDAIDAAPGYTIDVQQHNFVLMRWGGADGGEVQVGAHGTQAKATLARTGESNATYTIFDTGGATYFQRSTCQQAFRIPGENVSVLNPYMLAATQAIAKATDASVSGAAITATVMGLGKVTIQVDPANSRPITITGANASGPIVWTFRDWKGATVDAPWPVAGERGPGGIPC